MKLGPSTAGLLLAAGLAAVLLVGCGQKNDTGRFDTGPVITKDLSVNSKDYWRTTTFEVVDEPDGALPGVSAEDGGDGFEEIAALNGWQTNTDYESVGSPKAKKGGMISLALSEYPATLRSEGKDSNTSVNQMYNGMMYEALIGVDPTTLAFIPGLASHWKVESQPDGTQTFWFRINPAARFQTGHRVTTEDVLASYRLMLDDGLNVPYNIVLYSEYTEPAVQSPYIFSVSTKELNWRHFLYFGASMSIYPAAHLKGVNGAQYMEKFQNEVLPGSGGYVLRMEDVKQGNSLTLTRINNYWDKDNPHSVGLNNFDRIKIVIVQDETLNREKFKKGELDVYVVGQAKYWVKEFIPEEIHQLGQGWIQRKRVFSDSPNGINGFAFNMREAPFNDVRVRQAFSHILDVGKLIDKLFYNQYLPMHSYYPGSVYENPDDKIYEHNLDKALALLAEAGWDKRDTEGYLVNAKGERLEFDLMIDQSPTWERVMTVIQEDYKQAGIKFNLKPTTGATMFQMLMEHNFKIHWQNWGGLTFPNPESSFHSNIADQVNSGNVNGLKNARIDSLCEVYNVTFDQGERVRQIREIDKILTEECPYGLGWYGPFSRIGYWNKYDLPEAGWSRTGDWRSILNYWWYDADKHKALNEAINSDSAIPLEPVDVTYWPNYKD